MPIYKEYREWFLRHTQVNTGNKIDQEAGFPLQYNITGKGLVFNRFLKGDFPTENVFKKLFESLAFKLNIEDTAKENEQGLVRLATDQEALDRTNNTNNSFTNVIKPSQLPEVTLRKLNEAPYNDTIQSTDENGGLKLTLLKRTLSSKFRRAYKLEINTSNSLEIDDTTQKLQLVNDNNAPGNNVYYGTNNSGVKGFFSVPVVPELLQGKSIGTFTNVDNITYKTSLYLDVIGGPIPNLGILVGQHDLDIRVDVNIGLFDYDAFGNLNFEYGILINGTFVFKKFLNNTRIKEGILPLSIRRLIKITASTDFVEFYIKCDTNEPTTSLILINDLTCNLTFSDYYKP